MTVAGWDGLLAIDKPPGPTSHDVVARVRRLTGTRRVGHAGTLDPPASGLLPIVLGRATRLVRFLPQSPKCYEGTFELGRTTTSDDATGETLSVASSPLPAPDAVVAAAGRFVGRMDQLPPRVSARKVGGRRMYALARKGVEVVATPRAVEIFRFAVAPTAASARYRFRADVTAGTYIRALVRDLGEGLGCGGTLVELRRTAIGPLPVDTALALPADGPDPSAADLRAALVPLDRMPLALPEIALAPAAALGFTRGRTVEAPAGTAEGPAAVRGAGGILLGVGEVAGGLVRPRVVVPRD